MHMVPVDAVDKPPIAAHGLSHVGKVREENQDAIHVCRPDDERSAHFGYLYAIADGMGGYEHGGIASTLALEKLFESFYTGQPTQPIQRLRSGIQNANLGVYQAAQRLQARMGTTLTAVCIMGNRAHIAHIGDSRAYLIRNRQATCLTNDHTMVGDLVRMRLLSPDKVRTHNQRSVLNKSLGMELFVQPDITQVEVRHEDRIILCTDGVWSVVQDDDFARLGAVSPDTDTLSKHLIDLALEKDSDDNISAISLHLQRLSTQPFAGEQRRGLNLGRLFRSRPQQQDLHES